MGETTCCRPVRTWTGTRAGLSSARKERLMAQLSWRLLTPSSHPPGLLTSPSGCHSRMFTKLEVLEQSQWVVLKLVSSSPGPSRTSREDTSPLIPRTSQHPESPTSLPRLLSSITLARSPTDTALSLIATLRILLASLLRSRRRLTVVLVSLPKTTPSSSSLVTLPSSRSPPASPCVWNPSQSSLPLEGSLSVT